MDFTLELSDLSVDQLDVLPVNRGGGLEAINTGHGMVEIGASNCTSTSSPASCCSCCCC
ncbi:thiomuracin/GE37468 family thiazolyl RiPP peptide [Lentzea sp. E54]|uniref:thiomuracin/GE37468 family thiazolyl RiPP peptide n=1 Tax=Lentzea xerophila TaxID=3435883 RepID=UPI003DA47150